MFGTELLIYQKIRGVVGPNFFDLYPNSIQTGGVVKFCHRSFWGALFVLGSQWYSKEPFVHEQCSPKWTALPKMNSALQNEQRSPKWTEASLLYHCDWKFVLRRDFGWKLAAQLVIPVHSTFQNDSHPPIEGPHPVLYFTTNIAHLCASTYRVSQKIANRIMGPLIITMDKSWTSLRSVLSCFVLTMTM